VNLRRVPMPGRDKQNDLNCTGRGSSLTGRATTGSMVRQRSMRWKPLYLATNSQTRMERRDYAVRSGGA